MRRALALIWTSGALLCCGGRTAVDGAPTTSTPTLLSKTLGGIHLTSTDEISLRDVATSGDGRLAIGGYYRGRPDLSSIGATLPETSNEDGYVIVLDAQGRAEWAEPLPGLGAQGITGVAFAPNGDVVAQGSGNNRDTDATAASQAGTAWVLRLGEHGDVKLRKGFSGDRTFPARVASDKAGSAILVGTFTGQLDFYGPQALLPPYVIKLDEAGGVSWMVHLPVEGDPASIILLSVAVGTDGATFVAGTRDDLATSSGFLVKLTPAGSVAWTKEFTSSSDGGYVVVHDVTVDADGHPILVGNHCGNIDIDGLPETAPHTNDAWVARFDAFGNVLWAKDYDGLGTRRGAAAWAVSTDAERAIWVAGNAEGLSFQGKRLSPTSGGSELMFVLKLLSNGDEAWARSSDAELAGFSRLQLDAHGTAWTGGDFSGWLEVDGRRELTQAKLDAFLMHIAP